LEKAQFVNLVAQITGHKVRVDVRRHFGVAVPKDALHRGHVRPGHDQERGARVAQVVEAQATNN
jgi:hypothetical protein